MIKWGVVAGAHDASLSVMYNNEIVFASASERFSRVKNDKHLNQSIVNYALRWGYPHEIKWYENPFTKAIRKIYAGQDNVWLNPKSYMKQFDIKSQVSIGNHHKSHAAGGYYTSGFEDAVIFVIDSIGEFDTITVWDNMKRIHTKRYPNSLGLFYSAATAHIGLKPNEDEYILMARAAYGKNYISEMDLLLNKNLHRGFPTTIEASKNDIAYTTQKIYERELEKLIKRFSYKNNVVFMGGCALNCVANNIFYKYFDNVWIMPNPGDCGSSLGVLLDEHINWPGPYLGYEEKQSDPEEVVNKILKNKMCGVINGKAEFGPRALGNRSLLADPRDNNIKDTLNIVKKRQKYRPFAPVVLDEYADEYFEGNHNEYMQFTSKCKIEFDGVKHVDGSSRVQVIKEKDNPFLYETVKLFGEKTGIYMLINTSLNIKGMPIVNTREDGKLFQETYGVSVI